MKNLIVWSLMLLNGFLCGKPMAEAVQILNCDYQEKKILLDTWETALSGFQNYPQENFPRVCGQATHIDHRYQENFERIQEVLEGDYQISCDYSESCCDQSGITALACAVRGTESNTGKTMTWCANRRGFEKNPIKHLIHEVAHSAGLAHTEHKADGKPRYIQKLDQVCGVDDWWDNPDTFGIVAQNFVATGLAFNDNGLRVTHNDQPLPQMNPQVSAQDQVAQRSYVPQRQHRQAQRPPVRRATRQAPPRELSEYEKRMRAYRERVSGKK